MANRYWVGGTGNWDDDDNHWATSSGGAAGDGNLPTANDDVYFDANSFAAGGTVTFNNVGGNNWCKDFDATGLDEAVTFTCAVWQSLYAYGDTFILNSNITWENYNNTFNFYVLFYYGGTINFTQNSATLNNFGLDTRSTTCTLSLQSDFITTDGGVYLTKGGFATNGNTIRVAEFDIGWPLTRNVNLTNSDIYVEYTNHGSPYYYAFFTAYTLTYAGATVYINDFLVDVYLGANAILGHSPNMVLDAKGGRIKIFNAGVVHGDFTMLTAGSTYSFEPGIIVAPTGSFVADGSPGNLISIDGNPPGGSKFTFTKTSGIEKVEYCDIQDSNAAGGALWKAKHSVDSGNNDGWHFVPTSPFPSHFVI